MNKTISADACQNYEYGSPDNFNKLDANKKIYVTMPSNIILASGASEKRASAFSFFFLQRTLYNTVWFSFNRVIEWCGSNLNRHKNSTNDKFISAIKYLKDENYISLVDNNKIEDIKPSVYIEAIFNKEKLEYETHRKGCEFAIIYLDELEKIFAYNKKSKDNHFNKDILLLVFAYLRMRINRRPNKFRIEDVNLDNKNSYRYDVETRRKKYPEAYNTYYKYIAEELGIKDPTTVSKAVSVLNELELIYSEPLKRTQNEKGKWHTNDTLFANFYKREGSCLFASGESYYKREIEAKREQIKRLMR